MATRTHRALFSWLYQGHPQANRVRLIHSTAISKHHTRPPSTAAPTAHGSQPASNAPNITTSLTSEIKIDHESTKDRVETIPAGSLLQSAEGAKLPPIPQLTNKRYYQAVFMHSSVTPDNPLRKKPPSAYPKEEPAETAEDLLESQRLAWLGDAFLQAVATEYLYKELPNHPKGDLTVCFLLILTVNWLFISAYQAFRKLLVMNTQLEYWANAYQLTGKIITAPSDLQIGTHGVATVFEAYIGALLLLSGPTKTRAWLIELLKTFPLPQIAPLPAFHADTFQSIDVLAAKRGLKVKWTDVEHTPQPALTWQVTLKCEFSVCEGSSL
jgi:dsRNA-specific ribonuclease